MSAMHQFYYRLTTEAAIPQSYLDILLKLTRLSRDQVVSLKTILWWSGWHVAP